MNYCEIQTPIGPLTLTGDGGGLREIRFGCDDQPASAGWERNPAKFDDVRRQLDEYFDGSRRTFSLALAPEGTEFQLLVWRALTEIPFGETRSYAEIARSIGRPRAVRAVGAANGRNPLPIVVPCHRVIGSDGSLTGFAGGLPIKRQLLAHEAAGAAGMQLGLTVGV